LAWATGFEQHLLERGQFHAQCVEVELGADRVLHPAVRDQDPQCGEVRAERHEPGHDQVLDPPELVPAEEEQADERGLEEEGHQALERERHAEDVADVVGEVGPVGTELELHGEPGGHAHGEVDAEQQAPEAGHAPPDRPPGHDVHALHDREQPRQAERERHEQEVVERGQRELQARQRDHVEVGHGGGFFGSASSTWYQGTWVS
jgi:hypothetical protein